MNQSEIEASLCHLPQARENACKLVMIGFGLRKWREVCYPITERSTLITLDTQLNTTQVSILHVVLFWGVGGRGGGGVKAGPFNPAFQYANHLSVRVVMEVNQSVGSVMH